MTRGKKTEKYTYRYDGDKLSFGVLRFRFEMISPDTVLLSEIIDDDSDVVLLFGDEYFIRTLIREK